MMMAKPVLKSLKTRSYRFVVVLLLLCTLLTFNVGRVYRVEAMATTAAIAGAALLGTGAIYLGYLALTGGTVSIPSGTGQYIQDYLTDVGRKVAYYGSGAAIYNKIYSYLHEHGVSALNDFVVTWSQSDLLDLYNDFKDISINQSISSYTAYIDVSQTPSNTFDYPFTFISIPDVITGDGADRTFEYYINRGYELSFPSGVDLVLKSSASGSTTASIVHTDAVGTFRNVLLSSDNLYHIQQLVDGVWQTITFTYGAGVIGTKNNNGIRFIPASNLQSYTYFGYNYFPTNTVRSATYPLLPNANIYIESTGEEIEVVPVESTEVITSPNYDNNDDNNGRMYPVVPYVQLPSGGNWGFNLGDLITEIINRSAQTITAIGIGDLINRFMNSLGGDTGDYIYYSDNDNNYYIYYSNVYQGDDYTTYNINVGEQQEVIPVDLNTIQEYTDNVYLDTVKSSTLAFGSAIAEYFVFWHNADPVLFYTLCGSFIVILIGAFIGKWGHS